MSKALNTRLLSGCKRILSGVKPLKVAICTYHNERELNEMLVRDGFEAAHSDGFMLHFLYGQEYFSGLLRRGLIRAVKN